MTAYMFSRNLLMNDFLESFLLVFGEKNTQTKEDVKRFVTKQIILPKKTVKLQF